MLFNFIFEQPPVLFSLAANIEREREIVVVFVVRRPENAPGTTLLEALRRRLGLRRPRKFRRCCSRARIVWIVCLPPPKVPRRARRILARGHPDSGLRCCRSLARHSSANTRDSPKKPSASLRHR